MNAFVEILIILALILVNGFFSMAEIALVSARKVRLEQKAGDGDRGAAIALELNESTSRLLSSVQIGITLVGILTGALGGATLADHLSAVFEKVLWLKPYASGISGDRGLADHIFLAGTGRTHPQTAGAVTPREDCFTGGRIHAFSGQGDEPRR